jgi:hypothetical protein
MAKFTMGYNLLSDGRRSWLVQSDENAGWNWKRYLKKSVVGPVMGWGGPDWIKSAPSRKRIRDEFRPRDIVFCLPGRA